MLAVLCGGKVSCSWLSRAVSSQEQEQVPWCFFLGMQLHHSKAEKSDGQIMSCDLGFQKYRLLGNANCP